MGRGGVANTFQPALCVGNVGQDAVNLAMNGTIYALAGDFLRHAQTNLVENGVGFVAVWFNGFEHVGGQQALHIRAGINRAKRHAQGVGVGGNGVHQVMPVAQQCAGLPAKGAAVIGNGAP